MAPVVESGFAAPVLQIDGACVYFGRKLAVEDISIDVRRGERVAIVGPNGAGKTTLLRAIAGLVGLSAGRLSIRGEEGERRAHVAYVPQSDALDWSFPLTVRDVVTMGRAGHIGFMRRPTTLDRRRVEDGIAAMRLTDLADQPIGTMSGGQRRRTIFARAIAQDARLILLDEPFGGLDTPSMDDVIKALDESKQQGITVLLATHDLRSAAELCDRTLLLNRRVVAFGTSEEVLTEANLAAAYGQNTRIIERGETRILVGDLGGHGRAIDSAAQ